MPALIQPAQLGPPTTAVRTSYLAGEQDEALRRGEDAEWAGPAAADFAGFVAERVAVRQMWGVPVSTFWYVSGEHYLGTLVLRHRLTAELEEAGGHIGYHVLTPWQRQGHAGRMLAAGLGQARELGLGQVLLTCDPDNVASKKVIVANGGVPDGRARGEDRYWIKVH